MKGEANQALLDSYEAERRPMALTITASGDAMEELLTIGDDPAARAARDHTLREHFADPDSNHQEVVAEVELDVDYAGSPIVSREPGVLAAGARIPAELQDVITVPGHTLVVVATDSNSAEAAPWLLDDLGARTDTDEFFDDSMLLNAVHDPDLAAKLAPTT